MYADTYIYIYLRRWGTKASLQTTAVLQRARADTLLVVFFSRGPLHVSPAEPDLLSRPPCQKQNWISMSELHGYGLHMGAGWAAESLAQGHLKVPQAHSHDCSIARSTIEQPCHNLMAMGCTWVRAQVNRRAYPLQTMTVPLPEAELNSHGRRIDAGR